MTRRGRDHVWTADLYDEFERLTKTMRDQGRLRDSGRATVLVAAIMAVAILALGAFVVMRSDEARDVGESVALNDGAPLVEPPPQVVTTDSTRAEPLAGDDPPEDAPDDAPDAAPDAPPDDAGLFESVPSEDLNIDLLTATSLYVPYICPVVVHTSSTRFPDAPSYVVLSLLVAGVGGPVEGPVTLTVDIGGFAMNSAPLIGYVAEVLIPITEIGGYTVSLISADSPNGTLSADFVARAFVVGAAEGPVGGCLAPIDAVASTAEFATEIAGGMWLGDELVPVAARPAPSDPAGAVTDDDFAEFLTGLAESHQANDVDSLLASLDVATIDRYGELQCREYLNRIVGSFVEPVLLLTIEGPWFYETDAIATIIPDAWQLDITVFVSGAFAQIPMWVRVAGAQITWFTDCGEPLS